jgi:betaine lipid synthase
LRIHTDEINEVISRIAPGTLTIAVVMDSMDWFDPQSAEATSQIRAFNRALKLGGRVLLRSAGLKPWYASLFEALGFSARRVGIRLPGTCIDR